MDKLEEELEETKRKAREWKEYSNMQRFKTEVLVDMVRNKSLLHCYSCRCWF